MLAERQGGVVGWARLASKVLQQLDLAQGALGQDLLAEDIGDLLDCNFIGHYRLFCDRVWGCLEMGPDTSGAVDSLSAAEEEEEEEEEAEVCKSWNPIDRK